MRFVSILALVLSASAFAAAPTPPPQLPQSVGVTVTKDASGTPVPTVNAADSANLQAAVTAVIAAQLAARQANEAKLGLTAAQIAAALPVITAEVTAAVENQAKRVVAQSIASAIMASK